MESATTVSALSFWQRGKCLTWNMLIATYLASVSMTAGSVAKGVASRKDNKYSVITQSHVFIPLVIETLGPINFKELKFLSE